MLSAAQVASFRDTGYLILESFLSDAEVDVLDADFERLARIPSDALVYEDGTDVVRGHHGAHAISPVFADLVRLTRFVDAAQTLLGSAVYVHQFKINAKRALVGDLWEWHQDFQFWHAADGMPSPRAVNFAVFMDEVTEFNGPLTLVTGSHDDGLIEVETRAGDDWQDTLSSALRYRISPPELAQASAGRQMVAPKGPRGTVLVFDCSLLHASAPNMSAHDRRMAILSYNSVENTLRDVPDPRPDFIASRDFTPLQPVPDDALVRTDPALTST